MPQETPVPLVQLAKEWLDSTWAVVTSGAVLPNIPAEIHEAIARSINSSTKTYRYVLPTQLAAKAADSNLDCRAVQAGSGLKGAFDARSLCHEVVVPFDRANENVLGGAPSPYLNNPLRIPAILESELSAQRNKEGFGYLIKVLEYAEANPNSVPQLLQATLSEVYSRLATARVRYSVPNRISQKQTIDLITRWLHDRSGGVRLQSLSVAMFKVVGEHFHLFDSVVTAHVNAADLATGHVADIECKAGDHVVLAAEVKDRPLTKVDLEDKLLSIREKGVTELLFVTQGGVAAADATEIEALVEREFAAGQNVYVAEFVEILKIFTALLAEGGRRRLLVAVGVEMEERRVDLLHKRAWKDLLSTI